MNRLQSVRTGQHGPRKIPIEGLLCNYSHRTCMSPRLDGSEFCDRHALDDKHSPFKQCSYVSAENSKHCLNAAHKIDKKDGFCGFHARRALSKRQHAGRKRRPAENADTLLERIEHYGSTPHTLTQRNSNITHMSNNTNKLLEYASSSDSDDESHMIDSTWTVEKDSDVDSVDSEQEDTLKHAGVYTAEEVALVTRDKLIRLQSLYIDQFKRLQYIMKEKRRAYLKTAKQEKATMGSLQSNKGIDSQHTIDQLVSMNRYHRKYGKEALLDRQSKERRLSKSEGSGYKVPTYPKCIEQVDGVKCAKRTVPLSKYCQRHILSDVHQVLYRQCLYGNAEASPSGGCDTGVSCCQRPVIGCLTSQRCVYHTELNPHTPRVTKEDDDGDSSVDVIKLDLDLELDGTEAALRDNLELNGLG